MKNNEGLYEFFVEVPVALYRSSPDGRLMAANKALANLLGWESVEALLSDVAKVENVYVDPESRTQWVERISRDGVVSEFDVHLRRRDGTMIWVRDTARSVTDGDGNVAFFEGALIDVTERRATQEKLTEMVKAKDEFVATVSHELRNPIAAVVGLSEELAEGWNSFSDDIRRELARVIHHQADELAAIVEDLLVASRDEVGEISITKERLDPVAEVDLVLEAVETPVKVVAEPGVDLSVLGDPRRFRQVMRNLIGNAHRYGGARVEVNLGRGDASVNVEVRDDGPGVATTDVERIFEPYQRANGSNHPSSVGLGLPVARKLARLMGGDVTYSRDGDWSVFTLALPRFDSTSA